MKKWEIRSNYKDEVVMKSFMFVVPSLSKGGAERVVSVLASGLAERGYFVTVLRYFKTESDYMVNDKVNVVTLSQTEDEYDRMSKFVLFKKMHRVFKQYKPDYIIPFLRKVNIQTAIASLGFFKKIVYTVRVSPYLDSGIYGKIHKFLINHTNKTIVQNYEQKEYYSKYAQKRIYVLPNPVDERFLNVKRKNEDDKEFRIVSLGRLEKQKNFSMLIKAFEEFARSKENVYLDIYGEGGERENLQVLINELALDDIVTLKGRSNDVPAVFEKANLYVLSSNFEGMPNALLEAMAAGLPCISTECKTGPKEMIENKVSGILVSVGDEEKMFEALKFIYENKVFAAQMGRRAKNEVLNNYTIDEVLKKFLIFFN